MQHAPVAGKGLCGHCPSLYPILLPPSPQVLMPRALPGNSLHTNDLHLEVSFPGNSSHDRTANQPLDLRPPFSDQPHLIDDAAEAEEENGFGREHRTEKQRRHGWGTEALTGKLICQVSELKDGRAEI